MQDYTLIKTNEPLCEMLKQDKRWHWVGEINRSDVLSGRNDNLADRNSFLILQTDWRRGGFNCWASALARLPGAGGALKPLRPGKGEPSPALNFERCSESVGSQP